MVGPVKNTATAKPVARTGEKPPASAEDKPVEPEKATSAGSATAPGQTKPTTGPAGAPGQRKAGTGKEYAPGQTKNAGTDTYANADPLGMEAPAKEKMEFPKTNSSAKDWGELGYHLAGKGDKTDFKDTDMQSHIQHHIDDAKTLDAIGKDTRFTVDEQNFANEKATQNYKYATIINDVNRYRGFYGGADGTVETADAAKWAKDFEMFDGEAGISDLDREKADAKAKEQGLELYEIPADAHGHPPKPEPLPEGEFYTDDLSKSYRNIDKSNKQNVTEEDIQKYVANNEKMAGLIDKAKGFGYAEKDPIFASGVKDLDKKAQSNAKTGTYLFENYANMALADMNKEGGNFQGLSVDDIKTTAAADGNAEVMNQNDQMMQVGNNFAGIFEWMFK